jgi:hypothetical protein
MTHLLTVRSPNCFPQGKTRSPINGPESRIRCSAQRARNPTLSMGLRVPVRQVFALMWRGGGRARGSFGELRLQAEHSLNYFQIADNPGTTSFLNTWAFFGSNPAILTLTNNY